MFGWVVLLAALSLGLFGSNPVQAGPVLQAMPAAVDSFATAQPLIQLVAPGDVGNTNQSTAAGGGILGGERDIQISMTAGTFPGNRLSAGVGAGVLGIGFEPTIQGTVEIQWDGADGDPINLDPVGLGGVDLTQGGAQDEFLINIVSDDLAASLVFEVFTDAGNSSTFTLNLPGGITMENRLIPFSSFTGTADFTNVGAIRLTIMSTTELDLVLDAFGTNGPPPTATPTPTPVPDDDDDEIVADSGPGPSVGGGGSGAPAGTPAAGTPQPGFPTELPATGEPPANLWSQFLIVLLLVIGAGLLLKVTKAR